MSSNLKAYRVTRGIYNEVTGEQYGARENLFKAKSVYEAHKIALRNCDMSKGETVLKIISPEDTGEVNFDFKTGFGY